jgi:hypothetical protein
MGDSPEFVGQCQVVLEVGAARCFGWPRGVDRSCVHPESFARGEPSVGPTCTCLLGPELLLGLSDEVPASVAEGQQRLAAELNRHEKKISHPAERISSQTC